MNAMRYRTTNVDLPLDNLISLDQDYETTPISAITPIPPRPDEEELYTEFEAALRKRSTTFGSRFKHLRDSAPLRYSTQRALIYSCCALSCIFLGFDLMGLLVLHMR